MLDHEEELLGASLLKEEAWTSLPVKSSQVVPKQSFNICYPVIHLSSYSQELLCYWFDQSQPATE